MIEKNSENISPISNREEAEEMAYTEKPFRDQSKRYFAEGKEELAKKLQSIGEREAELNKSGDDHSLEAENLKSLKDYLSEKEELDNLNDLRREGGDNPNIDTKIREKEMEMRRKFSIKVKDSSLKLEPKEITDLFGVSKKSAYRSLKKEWVHNNYHLREIKISPETSDSVMEKISESAEKGVTSYIVSYASRYGIGIEDAYGRPIHSKEDFIQEAMFRLFEISGHKDFENEGFRVNVVKNATRDYMNYIRNRGKHEDSFRDPDPDSIDGLKNNIFRKNY